jgi:methionyl-tRNA synthetase
MALADRANQYVDKHKPWALAKDPSRAAEVQGIATQGINLFRVLMNCLVPVLPTMSQAAGEFLGAPFAHWDDVRTPLLGTTLASYKPLVTRLDPAIVAELIASAQPLVNDKPALPATSAAPTKTVAPANAAAPPAHAAAPAFIGIADFQKMDLRVARVAAASTVDGSDKLLRLTLDLGDSQRTVFSGIRAHYSPEQLVDRLVVVIANLAPRKMRFGVSEGMVLCASGADGEGLFLLATDSGAKPGMKIS